MRTLALLLLALAGCRVIEPNATGTYAAEVHGHAGRGWWRYSCTVTVALVDTRPLVVDSVAVGEDQVGDVRVRGLRGTHPVNLRLRWEGQLQSGSWDLVGLSDDTLDLSLPDDTTIICP